MSAEEILTKLLEAMAKPAAAPLPVSVDLWDTECIARYLKRSADSVRRLIIVLPGFPKPVLIPCTRRPQGLWKAREVVAWAERQT